MARRWIHLTSPVSGEALGAAFEAVRSDLKVPAQFPPEVLAEADTVAADPPRVDRDETTVPFVTIDPPGSLDLDQAMHLERDGQGYHLRYAIADVPAFVRPGGAIDAEDRRRGQTIYCPDQRTGLHPPRLSEDAASLLPDQVRPAFVWDLHLDADGSVRDRALYRAMVRSTARLDYASVQRDLDGGSAPEVLQLLRAVGLARIEQEQARGGASLPMPEEEVVPDGHGGYTVSLRPLLPVEDWNAQISLLTGFVAADLMLGAKVGILRTMPPAHPRDVERFRLQAKALGVDWPSGQSYGDFLRELDRTDPRELAVIYAATTLFRGAGYTPFDGTEPQPREHAALASPYAHVTAPLRRLVDRFGLAICEAIASDQPVPDWARAALPELPAIMKRSDHQAKAVERACTDAVEAAVLHDRVGDTFEASVVELDDRDGGAQPDAPDQPAAPGGQVQLTDPPVLGPCAGPLTLGARLTVRLVEADTIKRRVRFTPSA